MTLLQIDKPLPVLRADIEIFAGPLEEDGSPIYILHDPVSGSYSKIGWEEGMVLKRLRSGQTLHSLSRELEEATTLRVTPEAIAALCEEAENHGLTMGGLVKPPGALAEIARSRKPSPLGWLARHYLYFRIPLFHPDRFLARALPPARKLVSPPAKLLYALAVLVGLYFLFQRFEAYVTTFSYFYHPTGFIAFGAAIVGLKAAHELGHALVAKHYGLRVPTMGIAFMVFFPVAYTDVTDAWRLRSRRRRLNIALAGIGVELVIGAFALGGWGMTPPGILNSICFVLSSTTLASTLLVNLNPAMRFDGYYILSDLWGIDNLSSQSAQFTRWYLKQKLLGLKVPCPVNTVSRRRQLQMILYALFAWHYRFFLYLGIAVLVYHKFTKPLGITLFALEIYFFILHPALGELTMLRKEKERIRINKRLFGTILVLVLLLGWAALPLPRVAHAPAVYLPAHSQTLYAQLGGRVAEIRKSRGDRVGPGDVLLTLESEALNHEIDCLALTVSELRHTMERLSRDAERLGRVPEIERQLASRQSELAGLMAQREQLVIRARISGIVAELDEFLKPGCYVKENQVLGRIAAFEEARIEAFVAEKELGQVQTGQTVVFYPRDHSRRVSGRIERANPMREEYVDIMEIGSAAAESLPLMKVEGSDKMALTESYFKVHITPAIPPGTPLRLGTSGQVRFHTAPRSLVAEWLRYGYSLLIRESGF